jgi:aspartate/methionine/tyrosine aminotransferase
LWHKRLDPRSRGATMAAVSRVRGLKIANRSRIDPFMAMDVLAAANARAAAGHQVVHLEVGEPGEGPPAAVLEAAKDALGTLRIGYTEALGLPALRQAIAAHYRATCDLAVAPDHVIVTPGASGAFVLGFLAAFDPGDRVVVPEPAFPAYKNTLRALGVEVVRLGLGVETAFKPTPALLDTLPGPIHGLIVASPANPTGTMLDRAELAALVGYCQDRRIRIVADEIYHGITYERPAATILELDPDAIVINGFSKYFCMTGWRLGWLVAPPELVRPIELLAQNLFISAPALAQHAGVVALACREQLDRRIATYAANRELLLERLPEAGFARFAPVDGAFYLYAETSHLAADSAALCREILESAGVALTPGADFDSVDGHRHLRFAFCGSEREVAAGAERLVAWRRAR